MVRDAGRSYRAITVGGLGLNAIGSVAQVEAYVASVKRLQAMVDDPNDPIVVSLTIHPPLAPMFPLADQLAHRKRGEPNPFVNPAGIRAELADLLRNGEERVAIEKAKMGSK